MKRVSVVTLLLLLCCGISHAQKLAVKSNLLYGAGTLTPNLGVELGLGQRTTLHVGWGYNPWNLDGSETDNKKMVHWLIRPEGRYWFGERFKGHFVGVHALGSEYNISGHKVPTLFDKEYRYEGYAVGGGISYGYLWNWNSRWGMEFTAGLGVAYLNYDKYDCVKCGNSIGNTSKTYFGPTNAGITLVYKIGGRKKTSPPAPVYVPPIIEPVSEPVVVEQPESIVVEQPEPEPIVVVEPTPTTAETLAQTRSFLAPIAELDDSFAADPDRYINDHRDGSLSICFRQGSKTVEIDLLNNMAVIEELLLVVRQIESSEDSRVALILIAGFASPEGTRAVNDLLANERAAAIKGHLLEQSTLAHNMIDLHNGGVDWVGLRKLVAESDMSKRQQVLDIIDNVPAEINYRTNTSRKKSLMDLDSGRAWREMQKELFPELRNAAYIRVYYQNK